ncbi:14602_t:CDS:2 [Ambispora leptoticha]|uniref:Ubiquitin-like-conjugating enzyme ATG10 n=1 Tax=Ambispora leptoticha TaxID=144679 RepID=A0A9N8VF94_9GLOM|nr:14602_t:CDS:2 [Ambispora leptoticha]
MNSIYEYPYLTRGQFELAAKAFIGQSIKAGEDKPWTWIEHEKLKNFGYLSQKSVVVRRIDTKKESKRNHEGKADSLISIHEEDVGFEELDDPSAIHASTTSSLAQTIQSPQNDNSSEQDNSIDNSALRLSNEDCLTIDYNILYSPTYKVPVLYFNAYNADGSILNLDQLYTTLIEPSRLNDLRTAGFNGGLSQQDHPTLQLPFFFLHPCETATLMRTIALAPPSITNESESQEINNNVKEEFAGIIPIDGYLRSWLSLVGPVVGTKVTPGYFIDS